MDKVSIVRRRSALAAAAWTLTAACGLVAAAASPDHVPEYQHDVWTTADGLPQNSVTDLTQTDDGYLWLSTYGGLVRFDGVRFRVFDVASTPELGSNSIVCLDQDRDGNLWMGHGDEGVTLLRDGAFTTFTVRDGLPPSGVWALEIDRQGRPWAGTSDGLSHFENGRFVTWTRRDGLPSDVVLALVEDRRGAMWIGTGDGLARHDGGGFTVFGTADGLPSDVVTALYEDRGGTLWVGTEGALARAEGERFAVVSEGVGVVRSIVQDRGGRLWIAADDKLTRMASPASGEGARHLFPERFEGDRAWAVIEDREGNVWVGTEGKGLSRLKEKPVTRYTTADGLPGLSVLPVIDDGEGGLWLGSQLGELTHFRDGAFTAHRPPPGDPPLAWVVSLAREPEGALWIGHSLLPPAPNLDPYLSRYEGGVFRTWTRHDGLPGAHIRCLYVDRAGRLWIGTQGEGLALFEEGRLTRFTTRDGLVHDDLRFITEDREGALWIGTRGGASRFLAGRFTNYTAADGLSGGPVRAIHEDEEGTVWLGTYGGGLSRLEDGEITRYTMDDGLFDNAISRILEDGRGRLWMLGNLGLFFATRQMLNDFAAGTVARVECVAFGEAEGMVEGNGGFQPAGWRTADGRMWFPTISSLASIDAERFEINRVPPPVAIERLVVDGVARSPLGPVRLPPGQGNLELHYTGLSLVAPEKVRFRYQLEGYDGDWVEAGARREAYYTNIAPGDYTFRVIAANNHAVWNREGASLAISLAPHYYQTRWFQALGVLLLAAAAVVAFQVKTRRMEARNRRLKAEIGQRRQAEAEQARLIAELAAKNAELERFTYTVSHDLKAPLVTIKGFAGLLRRDAGRGDAGEVERDVVQINAAADQMARLLNELLELSRLGRVVNPSSSVALEEVVREAVDAVAGPVSERTVEIRVEPDLPTVHGDRVRLQEVFQNLLENAVRHTRRAASPRVEVGVRSGDGEEVVYVRDNGVGIEPRYHDKIFGLFERLDADGEGAGVGLAIVKRIVEFHGGRIWVESEGLGGGATFCLTLPRRPE
jgi:signal transduction histidine kinase/ligand-binding sensor domain-containing protein